jgi:ketosteroid isomerase-like protein
VDDRSRQVEEFVREWAAAEQRGDAAFLEGAYRRLRRRGASRLHAEQAAVGGAVRGGLSYESFALEEVDVRIYGDAAVTTCRQLQAGEFQGNDIGGEFRATVVLVEREGRWLMAGWHASPIAEAPSFLDR